MELEKNYFEVCLQFQKFARAVVMETACTCLLYTSDAADDLLCVDLGGRRIIKKKKKNSIFSPFFSEKIIFFWELLPVTEV